MIVPIDNIKNFLTTIDLEKFSLIRDNLVDMPQTFELPYKWFMYIEDESEISNPHVLFCIKFNYKLPNSVHLGVIEVNKDFRRKGEGRKVLEYIANTYHTMDFTLTPKDILEKERPLTDLYYPSVGFEYVDGERPYMILKK